MFSFLLLPNWHSPPHRCRPDSLMHEHPCVSPNAHSGTPFHSDGCGTCFLGDPSQVCMHDSISFLHQNELIFIYLAIFKIKGIKVTADETVQLENDIPPGFQHCLCEPLLVNPSPPPPYPCQWLQTWIWSLPPLCNSLYFINNIFNIVHNIIII